MIHFVREDIIAEMVSRGAVRWGYLMVGTLRFRVQTINPVHDIIYFLNDHDEEIGHVARWNAANPIFFIPLRTWHPDILKHYQWHEIQDANTTGV